MRLHDFSFVDDLAAYKGDDLAFVSPGSSLNFEQLEFRSRRIAAYLDRQGITKVDLVCTILPSHLNWLFTIALQRLGIPTMTKNSLRNFSQEVKPTWLISLKTHHEIPASNTVLVDQRLIDVILRTPKIDLFGYQSELDLARLFSTSGTSGETKHIPYLAHQLEGLISRKSSYGDSSIKRILSLYPYGSGQTYGLALRNLVQGKTFFAIDRLDPFIPGYLVDYEIDTLSGSPTQISSFLDILQQTGTELPNLKTVIMGGSAPSEKLIERLKSRLDVTVFNAYGSSEAGNICIEEFSDSNVDGFSSIQEDVTLQIVDDNNQPLPPMSVGHIRYHRPGMATSYFNNPVATAEHFKDGFFYPGDLGYLDHAGRLVLQGRSNEVINLGGVKINPELIDAIAIAQPGVLDCAAFSASNEKGIEELAIALVVGDGFNKEGFEAAMKQQSPYPLRKALLVEQIPRNENGKIQRNLLAKG
jgi:long-chain acyl-CoA synthetase